MGKAAQTVATRLARDVLRALVAAGAPISLSSIKDRLRLGSRPTATVRRLEAQGFVAEDATLEPPVYAITPAGETALAGVGG